MNKVIAQLVDHLAKTWALFPTLHESNQPTSVFCSQEVQAEDRKSARSGSAWDTGTLPRNKKALRSKMS